MTKPSPLRLKDSNSSHHYPSPLLLVYNWSVIHCPYYIYNVEYIIGDVRDTIYNDKGISTFFITVTKSLYFIRRV